MKIFHALALLAFFPSLAIAQVARELAPPFISTSGESTVYVAPDNVTLSVGVETFDPSLDKAKSELDSRSQRLLAAIKDAGIETKDVQTDTVQVSIVHQSGDERQVKGYLAQRSYAVKINDVKRVEAIVDIALKNGATHLFGIDYQTTELRKYRDEGRKMAIKAAKEKAMLLAGELEMKVGSPRQISEASFWSGYYGGGSYWGGRYGGAMVQNSSQSIAPNEMAGEGTMPMGLIAVRAQVNVTFDMSPAK